MKNNSTSIFNTIHLYNRASFGISPIDLDVVKNKSIDELVNDLFTQAAKFDALDVVDKKELSPDNMAMMDKAARKELNQKGLLFTKKLNATWLNKMIENKNGLREKMTLFWSNHFSCRLTNAVPQQDLNNICRKHALGNFGDLLVEVSKSPAMLQFLNNQQNRKKHPNENFAREVMELFTLGRGNYTEQDIKEAARAFTGYGFNAHGEFQFNELHHDTDSKTILNQTGNFNGDDVLQILLNQKQCAVFITRKIYKAFINQTPNEKFITEAANFFYQSKYDIEKLMRYIFLHPHFYDEKNIASQIKSPIELLVGMLRNIPVQFDNADYLYVTQKVMGQVLFLPPNVAGWQGGTNWIDSSSLLYRMRLPYMLFKNEAPIAEPKAEADDQLKDTKMKSKMAAHADWNNFYQYYSSLNTKEVFEKMKIDLLGKAGQKINFELLENNLSETNVIKSIAMRLMEMPEFQLC